MKTGRGEAAREGWGCATPGASGYLFAIALTLVAFGVRWALNPQLGDHQPWFTFYVAVALTAWRCGWKPSLAATLLGLGGGIPFILPPQGDLGFQDFYPWVQVLTYIGVSSALATLLGRVRVRHRQTEVAKQGLEEDVQTLDLANALAMDMDERIVRWNTGSQCLYGYTKEQALGRNTHELLQTQFPVPVEQVRSELQETGSWRGELQQRRADGTEVVVASEWVLDRDAAGKPRAILEVNTDITARKRAEQSLAETNRRTELLAEAAARLLSTADPDEALNAFYGRIAACLQTDTFFEYEMSPGGNELCLKSCWGPGGLKQPCDITRLGIGEGIAGTVAAQRKPIVRSRVQESDRSDERYLRAHGINAYACFPLVVGSHLVGTLSFASRERREFTQAEQVFFSTLADYVALAKERRHLTLELEQRAADLESTVQERTARLREMMAEMRQMSYSMVHEMRAPLRAIIGYAQILSAEAWQALSSSARNYLDRIQSSAARMDLLVSDALNYNKILRERVPLEPVDPGRVLSDTLTTLEEFQPPLADIQLKGPFPRVLGHRGLLAQCFCQLLRNSVRYVEPDRVPCVQISAERTEGHVRLCFSDNGIGIPREFQGRIFDLFERGRETGREGTGTGLALVRKMTERMHGRVWVESEPGHGSRFWLEFQAAA